MKRLTDKLFDTQNLNDDELKRLLCDGSCDEYLRTRADEMRRLFFGNKVYIRGLIEISNFCKNDCFYCGIRCSNHMAKRYRLSKDEILDCCREGYSLGFRTFVLQGGEDSFYTDEMLCSIITDIKKTYSDCAVTLSLGERCRESYKRLYDAGADRYLLRHETANAEHYGRLHPEKMKLSHRKQCLFDLKEIGFQTGSGFMVGSPFQTIDNIIEDIRFLQELSPHMIGIGPFITHKETPFAEFKSGSLELTLRILSVLRLMFPKVLLPSTTALGTIHPRGRERGLMSGANVVMPNLSPVASRKLYALYDNKICTNEEAAESLGLLKTTVLRAGYEVVVDRGDAPR